MVSTTSYFDRRHWQCWIVPQIFLTRGSDYVAVGFRWLFWGASIALGNR
jgi:hypothetical protein